MLTLISEWSEKLMTRLRGAGVILGHVFLRSGRF